MRPSRCIQSDVRREAIRVARAEVRKAKRDLIDLQEKFGEKLLEQMQTKISEKLLEQMQDKFGEMVEAEVGVALRMADLGFLDKKEETPAE